MNTNVAPIYFQSEAFFFEYPGPPGTFHVVGCFSKIVNVKSNATAFWYEETFCFKFVWALHYIELHNSPLFWLPCSSARSPPSPSMLCKNNTIKCRKNYNCKKNAKNCKKILSAFNTRASHVLTAHNTDLARTCLTSPSDTRGGTCNVGMIKDKRHANIGLL